jgi:hypothetical protein
MKMAILNGFTIKPRTDKMNIRIILNCCLLLSLFPIVAFSQLINGVVLDKHSKPIPYANIGIVNGNKGTISDESGRFKIDLTNANKTNTLRFSCIGFYSKDYLLSSITNDNMVVVLDEKVFSINEVKVYPSKEKLIEFGKKKVHGGGWEFGGMGDGVELAVPYSNKSKIILQKFMFNIHSSNYDSTLFRVNIYSNNNGVPGDIINQTPIFIKSKTIGWNDMDLYSYKIRINNDFIISLEAIKGWKDSNECIEVIRLSSKNGKGYTLARIASQGTWQKSDTFLDYYVVAKEEQP